MPDQTTNQPRKPNWLNIGSFVILALGFFGGHFATILTDWNTRSSQVDTVIGQITVLTNKFENFTTRYNDNHETTSNELTRVKGELERIEEHLTHADTRIDRLESRGR